MPKIKPNTSKKLSLPPPRPQKLYIPKPKCQTPQIGRTTPQTPQHLQMTPSDIQQYCGWVQGTSISNHAHVQEVSLVQHDNQHTTCAADVANDAELH